MKIDDLTPEEVEMILASREERKKQAAIAELEQHAFTVAAEYRTWLRQHDAEDAYNTFVDDFGYEKVPGVIAPNLGCHREVFWRLVRSLIAAIETATQEAFH